MGNTFGKLFKITTFGESHGKALGAIVEGCPAGLTLDEEKIRQETIVAPKAILDMEQEEARNQKPAFASA